MKPVHRQTEPDSASDRREIRPGAVEGMIAERQEGTCLVLASLRLVRRGKKIVAGERDAWASKAT